MAPNDILSRIYPTASETKKREEEKNLYDEEEELADGNDNDSMLLDNNELTRTYERVVLEGSKIRIGCPHLLSIPITTPTISTNIMLPETITSLATRNRNEALKKQKQFAESSMLKTTLEKEKMLARRPILNSKHVKWFRNHVPLLNVNHFHHQMEAVLVDPTESLVVVQNTTISSDDEQENNDENSVIKITELSGTASKPNPKPPPSINVLVNNETSLREGQIQNNLLTNSVELLQLKQQQSFLDARTSENANEYVEARKSANMSSGTSEFNNPNNEQSLDKEKSASELYINEFGELVINKVSKYFAGKYTCLAYHGQSEVLLDVLVNSQASNNVRPEKALKLDGSTDQAHVNHKMASESGIAHEELIDNSGVYLNSDGHRTGNGPIEGRSQQQESADEADNKSSILDQINREPNGAQNKDNFDGEDKSKGEDETILSVDSISTKHLSQYKTRMAGKKLKPPKRGGIIVKPENIDDKIEREAEILETTFDSPKRVILDKNGGVQDVTQSSNYRLNFQRISAQIVKSEIIQLDDLKNIPGFLYSKQHLYCPLGHLQWKHIYPLVKPLCPSDPRVISSEFRCYHLAWRLISMIVSESFSSERNRVSDSCDSSILDILWFKDGDQLEFDTSGIEISSNLNIKLINILEQFSENADFISFSTESTQEHQREKSGEGRIGENLTKANMSSKWICPLRGRTIEIDGVRKDSVGRYTCALRMRISKLRKIIHKLYKLNRQGPFHHQYRSNHIKRPSLDTSYLDGTLLEIDATARLSGNDISCCNGQDEFSIGGITRSQQQEQQHQDGEDSIKGLFKGDVQAERAPMNIEAIKSEGSIESNQSPKSYEEMDNVTSRAIKTNSDHPLTKQIAIFKSILERRFSREQWLEYMEQQFSRLQDPLAVIQSFSLLVPERPGKCLCSIKF